MVYKTFYNFAKCKKPANSKQISTRIMKNKRRPLLFTLLLQHNSFSYRRWRHEPLPPSRPHDVQKRYWAGNTASSRKRLGVTEICEGGGPVETSVIHQNVGYRRHWIYILYLGNDVVGGNGNSQFLRRPMNCCYSLALIESVTYISTITLYDKSNIVCSPLRKIGS